MLSVDDITSLVVAIYCFKDTSRVVVFEAICNGVVERSAIDETTKLPYAKISHALYTIRANGFIRQSEHMGSWELTELGKKMKHILFYLKDSENAKEAVKILNRHF